jgi:hypothetical protein
MGIQRFKRYSDPPPPPLTPYKQTEEGGGAKRTDDQERSGPRRVTAPMQPQAAAEIPDTEATRLLQTINVRSEQQIELAELPKATIEAAIADGSARDGIRDLAGWVVSLLRAHRDYGWKIAPPAPRPDSPEALAAAFARYAADQEAARHADLPADEPWLPPPAPAPLNVPGALIRLWNNVQATLKAQISRAEFDAWIRRLSLLSVERGVATIMAPNALAKAAIDDCYLGMLRDLLSMFAGEPLEVRVILNPSAPAEAGGAPASNAPAPAESDKPNIDGCPTWIAAERWVTLPAMLRAALAGSELVDGAVQCRSPHLSRVLQTRFAREVDELISDSLRRNELLR